MGVAGRTTMEETTIADLAFPVGGWGVGEVLWGRGKGQGVGRVGPSAWAMVPWFRNGIVEPFGPFWAHFEPNWALSAPYGYLVSVL